MKRILLIQNGISNYRVPVYNLIAKHFDLTVLYSSGIVPSNVEFPVRHLGLYTKGPFTFYEKGLYALLKEYDVVIFPYDPLQISIIWSILRLRVFEHIKFIPWGIGVAASYNVKYDAPRKSSKLNYYLAKYTDASIFYSDYPQKKYKAMGVNEDKLFVAHNTVAIWDINEDEYINSIKDCILFVGSLYRQKGVAVLLESYKNALIVNNNLLPLYIIGSGAEYDSIASWISENNMHHKVFLKGAIYDEKELATYFLKARACVSPNQAGLSVQKSMGYGVPFITKKDAVTGGEIFDVVNGKTGILYTEDSQLTEILLDIDRNPKKYKTMGGACREFYKKNRTIEVMAQGAIDAINYVIKD